MTPLPFVVEEAEDVARDTQLVLYCRDVFVSDRLLNGIESVLFEEMHVVSRVIRMLFE